MLFLSSTTVLHFIGLLPDVLIEHGCYPKCVLFQKFCFDLVCKEFFLTICMDINSLCSACQRICVQGPEGRERGRLLHGSKPRQAYGHHQQGWVQRDLDQRHENPWP